MSDLPETGALVSDPDRVQLHDAGWVDLPSGAQITRLPLWDDEHQLFARLGWQAADEWAKARGYRLATVQQYNELHAAAFHVEPFPLPTREMCEAEGVPYKWEDPAYKRYQQASMRSHRWCAIHDAEVLARIAEKGWSGEPVDNAGKHWCLPLGGIYGWWAAGQPMIQGLSLFHSGDPGYTDYATTVHVVRDAGDAGSVEPGDTEPAPTPGPDSWRPVLRRGMRGDDVAAWQAVLYQDGARIDIDGDFGPATEAATKAWQAERELVADGIVGPRTRAAIGSPPVPHPKPRPEPVPPAGPSAIVLPDPMQFLQAKHYSPGPRPTVDWIILHSTENPPLNSQGLIRLWVALGVARWFAGQDWRGRPAAAPRASAHYVIGGDPAPANGVIQCVRESDSAWTAGVRSVNLRSVNLEIVGQAMRTDWSSPVMRPTLERAAALVARSCRRWSIPAQEVSVDDLRAARSWIEAGGTLPEHCRGIISHSDVTEAWDVLGGHQDPGGPGDVRWPWQLFLDLVRAS